jgi:hypothetical protein
MFTSVYLKSIAFEILSARYCVIRVETRCCIEMVYLDSVMWIGCVGEVRR